MIPEAELQKHRQSDAVFVTMLLFSITLIILQLWLFTATLENLLSSRFTIAIPAAIISTVCAAINAWMLAGLYRTEMRR
jgi:hypothetical protein